MKLLLLSGTFGCAFVVFAHRDYALQKGWPVGQWAFSDSSWIKILALVSMIGAPVLGLVKGPWWSVLVIPAVGFFSALIATNLLRSRVQHVAIAGLVLGWILSLVWVSSGSSHNWTRDELDNVQHLYASQEANLTAIRISNAGGLGTAPLGVSAKRIELNAKALEHAMRVREDVLEKAHPDLPTHFRNEYQRSLKLSLDAFRERDNRKSIQATMLHDRWVDWWNANKHNVRIPKR